MKLLKLLARVLPHSWFVALLSSRVCRGIRIRLISRSLSVDITSNEPFICFRLYLVCCDAFFKGFLGSEIRKIFKMNRIDAITFYSANITGAEWWNIGDPNREKYHNSLFFNQ